MNNKKRCHFLRCHLLWALIIIGLAMTACQEPEPEAVVPPALSGTVSISGIAEVGRTLTANTDSLGGKGTITYQWKRGTGNIGANSSTYVVQTADIGSTITVTVTRAGYSGSVGSPATAVILPPLAGTVSISGDGSVGQTLTINTSYLDISGDISYQWMRGTGDGAIIIGTDSTYEVQASDAGFAITVTITCSGYSGSFTSEPVIILPPLTGTVAIIGNTWTGQMLRVSARLSGNVPLSYQWKREGTDGGDAVNIGANSGIYVIQASDIGSTITVTVTRLGFSGSLSSVPTDAITIPPISGTVSISGNAWVGETLTANTSYVNGNGAISYQWHRWGPGDAAAIIGIGTDSTYEVQAIDLFSTITLTVTRLGFSSSLISMPTAAVILPPLSGTVTISGIAEIGQTLTADITNLGGSGTISYQWKRRYEDVGTDSNTYVIQAEDEGFYITVTVTRTGNSGSVRSKAIAFGLSPLEESVKKVEFTGATATVTFDNLSNNSVYLVKVNTSSGSVSASNTGSVQSVSPSSRSGGQLSPLSFGSNRPRMGHPAATAFNANPPPIVSRSETITPQAEFIPPVVGNTRSFWIEQYFDTGGWVQRSSTLLATGTYGNIWVMDNSITSARAQELAANFDIMYPAETNIFGFEYGGGPGGNGGKDGDPKVQILVYNIINANGGNSNVLGYFWSKDYYDYDQPGTRTNKAEIFYINAGYTGSYPELIYLTLAHEFQHMIHFNRKFVQNGRSSATWYNETLSMMAEDVIAHTLGIPTTHADHPIRDHVPYFIESYDAVGFTEWPSSPYPYSKGYTLGAYLMRNFGGVELLKNILDNNSVNTDSITAALNAIEPGMTFEKTVSRFGEAMIFSGNSLPDGGLTFDTAVTSTISGYNGTHSYTLPAFDIWTMKRYSSSSIGPVIYSLAQRTMRGHSVLVHQDPAWNNRSESLSITLNKPSSASVEFYLIVR